MNGEGAPAKGPVGGGTELRIELLGGFRVGLAGRTVPDDAWRRRKAAALVKLLALAPAHHGHPALHREQLLDALWPDLAPDAAANNLKQALYHARRALDMAAPGLGAVLRVQGERLLLDPPGDLWIDATEFERAATAALSADDPTACEEALARYGGDLLPEDRYEDWATARREALQERYFGLLLALARLREKRGELDAALAAFGRVVALVPAHEGARAGLMRLHAQAGRRQEALRQYARLRAALRREFDAEPDPATLRLHADILAGRFQPGLDRSARAAPPPPAAPPARHNLPAALTSFVGRTEALVQIRQALAEHRLVTLAGPGGSGKTRLALATARDLLPEYADGVWLVDLAPLAEPALIAQAVLAALGLRDNTARPAIDGLIGHLRGRQVLLVLDNCEHLVGACAALAAALLAVCARLRILATSREALHVPGELVWRVPPLTLPHATLSPTALAENEAIRLFCERAPLVHPGFALTGENAAAVVAICRQLDGLPLAIELAAARLAVLSTDQLAARLGSALGLLSGGGSTLPARQQTLRATLDWSYALLTEAERRLLAQLPVFAGSWSVDAAEAVYAAPAGEVLDVLAHLVDKSLVQVDLDASATGEARYRLLEPIRQYARERLADPQAAEARERHAAHYLALAERAAPELRGPRQARWLDRLQEDLDNARAALRWLLDRRDRERALRLASALLWFWVGRFLPREGLRWLEAGLQGEGATTPATLANALTAAGYLALWLMDPSRASDYDEQALAHYRALGDATATAGTLIHLAWTRLHLRDFARARPLLDEALALYRSLGDHAGLGYGLSMLGALLEEDGDLDGALACYEESLASSERGGDPRGIAAAEENLGWAALLRDKPDEAGASLREAIARRRDLGPAGENLGYSLDGLALVAQARGSPARAARLAGAAEAVRTGLRARAGLLGPVQAGRRRRREAVAAASLAAGPRAGDWAAGQAMSIDEAIRLALEPDTPPKRPAS